MEKINQKRNRSTNWDEDEKRLLRTVLKEYRHILEDKCLSTAARTTKAKAWSEIDKRFNELNGRHRDVNQLQMQWKTMKMNARKNPDAMTNEDGDETPENITITVRDLFNAAEVLKGHNVFDSEGDDPDQRTSFNEHYRTSTIDHYRMSISDHSKFLKEEEHKRRMEMAEEEHEIKMKILKQNLECSILEKEILLLKKEHQQKLINTEPSLTESNKDSPVDCSMNKS